MRIDIIDCRERWLPVSQNRQKQDRPFVQIILGLIFCTVGVLLYLEIIPLLNSHRFRGITRPLNDMFGKWWAVVFCSLVGLVLLLTGISRLRGRRDRDETPPN